VEVEQLVLLKPDSTTYDARLDVYRVDDDINNIHGMYDSWEIIHLRNVCTDGGYEGISTLQFAANTLNIASRIDSQQADFYKSGSTLRGFVSGDTSITQGFGSLQDEQLEAVSQSVEAQLNSGRKIFQLPGAMKFNQISLSPNDLQLLDSKKFTVLEICRFFGVHPDKVFSQSSTNYKASENSQTVFLSDTLQPLLKKISMEMNVKLIFVENMWRFRIFFNLEDYYEADILSKADYFGKMLSNAAMTPNEIRIKTGKAPQAGGDTVFISCNVAPVGSSKITGEQSSTEGEKTAENENLGANNE
jgi:HK97 family phage portal protein